MGAVEHPLMTVGREIYPDYQVLLWHNPEEVFDPGIGVGCRFRMVLVEAGTGILACGDLQHVLGAPALVCLNETERPSLVFREKLRARALYFHPNVINASFDFGNVRDHTRRSEWHDERWLRPFVLRDETWTGLVSLGPGTAARISHLFSLVDRELALQRDQTWPCRSRSYFLEILFLLDRLSTSADLTEQDALAENASLADIGPVLLYLHSHYDRKLKLDEIARAFNTNRTTLTREFHQATGQPVMTYLNRLRINLAALMLRDTKLSIDEIVARIGFTNLTHFGRAFRKTTGYSPREYRRRFCWMLQ
jgi:AraC family L-rhamnose operon regulatory protein RhaS